MYGLQRFAGGLTTQFFRRTAYSSSSTKIAPAAVSGNSGTNNNTIDTQSGVQSAPLTIAATTITKTAIGQKPKSTMVSAAFESLKSADTAIGVARETAKLNNNNSIEERILNAKTVNGLLVITENNSGFSRKHALKIVSILAEWSTINRVKLSEFENDARFLRICRMLGRTVNKTGKVTNDNSNNNGNVKRISGFRTDDLNTVLGVAGDDEAAKLIASISLPQMVKVMSTLAQQKRRSTPLLRSLAFNISSSTDQLDLKQCADVFFAMATLNFQDSVLGAKICADIQIALPKNTEKSAVVGSILTSLGILRYRDLDILETLTQWLLKNIEICRPQDLNAYFLTAALLNFKGSQIEDVQQKLAKSVAFEDFARNVDWLNYIWSLSMLSLAEHHQLEHVLRPDFVEKLQTDKNGLSPTSKMKLLNINSYAQFLAKDYKGVLLPTESLIYNVPMAHAKSKTILVNGMLDALKNLLPARNHVMSLVDSKMGFLIDAICYFDAKRSPLPLDKENSNAIKVALMVVDFHDICHGTHKCVSGITSLSFDLLERNGYRVIPVPYNEFNTSDKLLKRVQYLEAKFKSVISSK